MFFLHELTPRRSFRQPAASANPCAYNSIWPSESGSRAWSDPEGSRPYLGGLLLGYYADDRKLIYAGRVGTGCPTKFSPICDAVSTRSPARRHPSTSCRLAETRFGSPLVLSRVHWVEPKLVAEITYLTWTADNLLRHTVYVGLREDKPADQVRRERSDRHRAKGRLAPTI